MNEKIKEALTLAKTIIDYCPGDSWERECTEKDRKRFDELYDEFFPEQKQQEQEHFYCSSCERNFSAKKNYDDHLNGKKHLHNTSLDEAFKNFSKTCNQLNKKYNTCKLDHSLICGNRKRCKQIHLWANLTNVPSTIQNEDLKIIKHHKIRS